MKSPTTTQRWIIIAGLMLLAAMTLFPPWIYTFKDKAIASQVPAGYHFVAFSPLPRKAVRAEGVKMDLARLSVQTIAVATLVVLALLLASEGARLQRSAVNKTVRKVAARVVEWVRGWWRSAMSTEPRASKLNRDDPLIDQRALDRLLGNEEEGKRQRAKTEQSERPRLVNAKESGAGSEAGKKSANAALPEREREKLRKHLDAVIVSRSRNQS